MGITKHQHNNIHIKMRLIIIIVVREREQKPFGKCISRRDGRQNRKRWRKWWKEDMKNEHTEKTAHTYTNTHHTIYSKRRFFVPLFPFLVYGIAFVTSNLFVCDFFCPLFIAIFNFHSLERIKHRKCFQWYIESLCFRQQQMDWREYILCE